MKQLLLAISLFLFLMPKQGKAQIQEGTRRIGCVIDSRFSQNNSIASVAANQTKFINPHFGVGAGLSAAIGNFFSGSITSVGLGGNAMYVLNPSKKAPFYAELGLNFSTGRASISGGQITSSSSLGSSLGVGNLFFLNKSIALNTKLNWSKEFVRSTNDNYNQNTLSFSVSLNPFLQGSLFDEIELEEGESLIAANRATIKSQLGFYSITGNDIEPYNFFSKDIEASFFLSKGVEIGLGFDDNYVSPFTAFYLPMQDKVSILAELKYQRALPKNTLASSTWIPSLGAAYFLNKNIAVIGKLNVYPSKLSAFRGTGISLNLKYFLK
jgi:Outer membrane protein beta-barrel domain